MDGIAERWAADVVGGDHREITGNNRHTVNPIVVEFTAHHLFLRRCYPGFFEIRVYFM